MDPELLKVPELQQELRSRGLEAGGRKRVLVDRLRAALTAERLSSAAPEAGPLISEADPEEPPTSAHPPAEGSSELTDPPGGGEAADTPSAPHSAAPVSSASSSDADGGSAEQGLRHVRIDRMQRPLHRGQFLAWLGERLGREVDPDSLWLAPLKTHCFLTFDSAEQAASCVSRISGQRFKENPSILEAALVTEAEVSRSTQAGAVQKTAADVSAAISEREGPKLRGEVPKPRGEEPRLSEVVRRPLRPSKLIEKALCAVAVPRPSLATIQTVERGFVTNRFVGRQERAEEVGPKASEENAEEVSRKRDRDVGDDSDEGKNRHEAFIRLLDERFRKTKTSPHLYWLPVSDEVVARRRESIRNNRATALAKE